MPFVKAEPKQSRLRMLLYGPTGSGKTFTALLLAEALAQHRGGRVAFVDSEFMQGGSDFYAQRIPERDVHPEAFDFDRLETISLADAIEGIRSLDPAVHSCLVIDSLSHYWEQAKDSYDGRMVGKDEDKIPIQAWGKIKKPFKGDLVQWLVSSPFDVFCCARQKNVFNTEAGDWEWERYAPALEGQTEYEFPLRWRMEQLIERGSVTKWLAKVENDRTGVLAGRTLNNPTWSHLEPLVKILGPEQREAPDTDESLAKDAELLDKQKDRDRKKRSKSEVLFGRFQAEIAGAGTLEELGVVQAALRKERRYILEEHLESLRTFNQIRTRDISEGAAEGF